MKHFKLTRIANSIEHCNYYEYRDSTQDSFTYSLFNLEKIKKIKKPKIKYISVLPGVGKTQWAIERMVSCAEMKKRIFLFVAPTTDLLDQTEVRLHELFKENKLDVNKIHKIHGGKRAEFDEFDGSDNLSMDFTKRMQCAKKGNIFLITHALYFGLKDIPQKDKIYCVIDETNLIEVKAVELPLDNKGMESLSEYANFEIIYTGNSDIAKKSCLSSDDIKPYFKVTDKKDSKYKKCTSGAYDKKFYKLINGLKENKVDAYMMKGTSAYHFYTFPSENNYFQGFYKVVLMGAFLESSPAFNILSKNHRLVKKTIYRERQRQILRRISHLRIIPILSQLTKNENQDGHLSKTLFKESLLLKDGENINVIKRKFTKAFNDFSELTTYNRKNNIRFLQLFSGSREYQNIKIKPILKDLRKRYKHALLDLHDYLLKTACSDIRKNTRTLVVTNQSYAKRIDSNNYGNNFIFKTNHLHGSNEYKEWNTIIYLAALRYKPTLIRFYEDFIPAYKPHQHLLANNIIQAACRLNIRDVNSTQKAYLYVPSMETAELIQGLFYRSFNKNIFKIAKPLDNESYAVSATDIISVEKKPKKAKLYPYINRNGELTKTTRAQDVFNHDKIYRALNNQKTQKSREIKKCNERKNSEKHKTLKEEHAEILKKMRDRKIAMNLPGFNVR